SPARPWVGVPGGSSPSSTRRRPAGTGSASSGRRSARCAWTCTRPRTSCTTRTVASTRPRRSFRRRLDIRVSRDARPLPIVTGVPGAHDRAEDLLDAIGELYAVILRISRRIEERDAMTVTQRLALIDIAVAGPFRLCELASRMDTTPATASRAVDALEAFRLVARCPDPSDRRAVLLTATAKGRRWVAE